MSEFELIKAAAPLGKIEIPREYKNGEALHGTDMSPEQYADHDAYFQFIAWFTSAVAQHHGFVTTWCMSVADFTVPYEGAPTAVAYNGGWGTPHEVKLPDNPTILDVWKACDKAVRLSGDLHHCFIESLDNVNGVLHMFCGS